MWFALLLLFYILQSAVIAITDLLIGRTHDIDEISLTKTNPSKEQIQVTSLQYTDNPVTTNSQTLYKN